MMDKIAYGFSLVETLVVIAVMALVFGGIGYASLRDYSRRQRVAAVYRTLVSDLRYAQKEAASGVKPSSGCSGVLDGYMFEATNCFFGSCRGYNIRVSCGGSLTSPVKTVSLPSQIVMSRISSGVLFKSLGAGTNLSSDLTITLTDNSVNPPTTNSVYVLQSGEIK